METILWKVSQNGTSYTDMKTPSKYKLSFSDLDKDSYRSVTNGNLIRNRISGHWRKIEMSFNCLSNSELSTIAAAINTNSKIYVQCLCPAFGTNNWVTMQCYCSEYAAELLEKQVGWSVSFNLVECKR